MFNLTFFQGFLTPELTQYGLNESSAGIVMSIISVSYLLGCLAYPRLFKSVPRKLQFLMSIIGFTTTMLLMGPSKFFNFPNELYVILLAYPLMGLNQVFIFLPIIPEMMERMYFKLQVREGDSAALDLRLSDLVNEAYVIIYAVSSFCSPILGSKLYLAVGMRSAFDYIAGVNFVMAILLATFNCGLNVFKEERVLEKFMDKKSDKYNANDIYM
jgi:MFS family permease